MRTIYELIKESIFDDPDTQISRVINDTWFKQNATGNFKIKNKKSIIGPEIVGDIIIDGYDDEYIPVNVSKVNGSVYILNCPNLKSIENFFKYCLGLDKGGLYIENCPSLESLKGCPVYTMNFSCIGNKKIKSLEGAPENVFGNCYIMKNGKKFTEEQIKAVIKSTNRIDCGSMEEEANINESLIEPNLLKLSQFLKDKDLKFKDIGIENFRLDKITSKNVKTYFYPYIDEAVIKLCRSIISGKTSGFIIVKDNNNYDCFINMYKNMYTVTKYGISLKKDVQSTVLIDRCKNAGEVVIFFSDTDIQTSDIRYKRIKDREGVIYNTPEQNREIARNNVERYKKIASKIRAERNNEYEKIDERVENIILRVLKATQDSHRNPDKYDLYDISDLNYRIYSTVKYNNGKRYGSDGILNLYDNYTKTFLIIRQGKASDYDIKSEKIYKKQLLEDIDKLDNILKSMNF